LQEALPTFMAASLNWKTEQAVAWLLRFTFLC